MKKYLKDHNIQFVEFPDGSLMICGYMSPSKLKALINDAADYDCVVKMQLDRIFVEEE